jgi:hypothetical protein
MIDIPILFLGFNRPDLATTVLSRLRECGVTKLYVAIDGPRYGNERDLLLCKQMHSVVDDIDWAEEKLILNRTDNLGCGRAVSEAITWFFQHEEMGIIIEDDCLPDSSFFQFCEKMLNRHADNECVWSIAGTSLIPESASPAKSHFFSKYSGIWGWATWRRAWESYRYDLSFMSPDEWEKTVAGQCENAVERGYWLHILGMMLEGKIDTWDFQVQFCAWKQNALHVTSSVNLVQNIGFRSDATHTKEASNLANRSVRRNPPPYEAISVSSDPALDRIVFGEKLHASRELAEWLFGQKNLQELTKTAADQSKYILELEDHLAKRGVIIEALDSARMNHLQELKLLKTDLKSYSGLSGAMKCLRNKVK